MENRKLRESHEFYSNRFESRFQIQQAHDVAHQRIAIPFQRHDIKAHRIGIGQ